MFTYSTRSKVVKILVYVVLSNDSSVLQFRTELFLYYKIILTTCPCSISSTTCKLPPREINDQFLKKRNNNTRKGA